MRPNATPINPRPLHPQGLLISYRSQALRARSGYRIPSSGIECLARPPSPHSLSQLCQISRTAYRAVRIKRSTLNTRSKRAPDQKKDATTDILEKEFQSHPAGLASGQANTEQGKWLSPRTQVAAHIRISRSDYANLNEMSQPEGNATAGKAASWILHPTHPCLARAKVNSTARAKINHG